jgi:hypothetical protein
MKYLINYENFRTNINEAILPMEDVYIKHYSDLDKTIFDKIVQADPTTKLNKVGKYSKWLLKLFKQKNLKLEDLYKATEYLSAFDLHQHKLHIKDINLIKSLPELFKLVEPFLEKEEYTFSNDEERKLAGQFKEVFRNDDYRIIIPITLEASKYFGRDTEWCTLNSNMFNSYTKNQDINNLDDNCLYILYTENNLDDRLQFHFGTRQFMDVYDEGIYIKDFLEEHVDIKNFFNTIFDIKFWIKDPDDIIAEECINYGLNCNFGKSPMVMDEYGDEDFDWDSVEYDIIIGRDFNYDDNPMDGSMVVDFTFVPKNDGVYRKFIAMLEDIYKNVNIEVSNEDGIYYIGMSNF